MRNVSLSSSWNLSVLHYSLFTPFFHCRHERPFCYQKSPSTHSYGARFPPPLPSEIGWPIPSTGHNAGAWPDLQLGCRGFPLGDKSQRNTLLQEKQKQEKTALVANSGLGLAKAVSASEHHKDKGTRLDRDSRSWKQRRYRDEFGGSEPTAAWQKPHQCVSCPRDWTDS